VTDVVKEPDTITVPASHGMGAKARPARSALPGLLVWLVLLAAAIAFVYGATTIRTAANTNFGLLFSASPAFPLSILLVALGFALAVRQRNLPAAAGATILMIVVQRLPGSMCTDVPIYSWLYKHLGVVDYIQHEHALARGIDVYHGWPGLFALTAWFSDLTGVQPISIAHWFTIFFHFGFSLAVYAVARAWGLERLHAVAAVFLVESLNWVAQDYFAPQAAAVFFAAAFFICIGLSRSQPVAVPVTLLLFMAVTVTHQLTPYWLWFATAALVVSRKVKPWWIMLPLTVIMLGYLAYNIDVVREFLKFSFDVFTNSTGPIRTPGSTGQHITSIGVRVLAACMWLATLITLAVRWRRKQPFWTLAVLAFSPMVIIMGNSYGGEAIFRVFLYSLIGNSIVLAPVLVNALQGPVLRCVGGLAALVVAVALSAQGYFGAWFAYLMTKDEVDVARITLDHADFPSYFTPASITFPQRSTWRYVDYMQFSEHYDDPVIYDMDLIGKHLNTDADYKNFSDAFVQRLDASTYLVFTDQMTRYVSYFDIMPDDAFPNLKARVERDPLWHLWFKGNGVTIFEHRIDVSSNDADSDIPRIGDSVENLVGGQAGSGQPGSGKNGG
jgi:hypothetical protein